MTRSRWRKSRRTNGACARAAEITAGSCRRRTGRRARRRSGSLPWRRSSLVIGAGLRAFLRPGRRALSFLRPRFGGKSILCLRPGSWRMSWARARAVGEITAAPCRRRTRRRTGCLPGSLPRRRSSFVFGAGLRTFLRAQWRVLSILRPRSAAGIRPCNSCLSPIRRRVAAAWPEGRPCVPNLFRPAGALPSRCCRRRCLGPGEGCG